MSPRPKRTPDFRVQVQVSDYLLSHAFSNYADARRCYEQLRVSAFLSPIGNVLLINEREQRVLIEAINEAT